MQHITREVMAARGKGTSTLPWKLSWACLEEMGLGATSKEIRKSRAAMGGQATAGRECPAPSGRGPPNLLWRRTAYGHFALPRRHGAASHAGRRVAAAAAVQHPHLPALQRGELCCAACAAGSDGDDAGHHCRRGEEAQGEGKADVTTDGGGSARAARTAVQWRVSF